MNVTWRRQSELKENQQSAAAGDDAPEPARRVSEKLFQLVRPLEHVVGHRFHRSGWPAAMHALAPYAGAENPLLLEDFVEQNFSYFSRPRVYDRPWVGIFHHPPGIPHFAKASHDPERYLSTPAFRKSIEHLRLAVVLSEHAASYFRNKLPCPVVAVRHPTAPSQVQWSVKNFQSNGKLRLAQIGWYLRNTRAIFQLPAPGFEKLRLWRRHWNWYDEGVRRHWSTNNARREIDEHVRQLGYVDSANYDRLLSRSVVVNEFFAASANNVIVECIARRTPILTNRHPAVVEYLGEDYPLYFETPQHAFDLLSLDNIVTAHEYLAALDARWLSPEHFANQIAAAIRYHTGQLLKYAVVCSPRSGSSWLCELLASTGRAGRPDEWWNEDRHPRLPLDELVRKKQLHGVFGVKAIGDSNAFEPIHELEPHKVVWLRRRDQVAQAVSFYLATHTGRWDSRSASRGGVPPYDQSQISNCQQELKRQDQVHASFCENYETLLVWYEDVLADPAREVRRILQFLGRASPTDSMKLQTTLKIQRNRVSDNYRRRFREALLAAAPCAATG